MHHKDRHVVSTHASLSLSAMAAAMGRVGGLKGGPARAEALSPKRRSQIAKLAAERRWALKKEVT